MSRETKARICTYHCQNINTTEIKTLKHITLFMDDTYFYIFDSEYKSLRIFYIRGDIIKLLC